VIRRGGTQDVPFMRDMLRHAYYWRMTPRSPDDPPVSRYVDGWGRPGDTSVIALDELQRVGAAWYRLFDREQPGYGFVDQSTPELTVAVVPSRRGRGFGHELLQGLLAEGRNAGYGAVSLSVDRDNPSAKLYERYGFRKVRDDDGAFTMVATLCSHEPA
jgi:ribosomal protein S18 acetylase RimI-like enzyme